MEYWNTKAFVLTVTTARTRRIAVRQARRQHRPTEANRQCGWVCVTFIPRQVDLPDLDPAANVPNFPRSCGERSTAAAASPIDTTSWSGNTAVPMAILGRKPPNCYCPTPYLRNYGDADCSGTNDWKA